GACSADFIFARSPEPRQSSPGTKDSYTPPTTPSAGRTGGVLTCLTKSPELLLFVMPEEIKLKKYY
ncbi:MAG: hypothetical protein ACLRXA_24535, partial [Clostridium sp.]